MLIFLLFIGFFVVRYVLALRQYKRSSYYVVTRNSFFYVRSDNSKQLHHLLMRILIPQLNLKRGSHLCEWAASF